MRRSTAILLVALCTTAAAVVAFVFGRLHGKASVEPFDTSADIAFHTQLLKELNAGRTNKVAHRLNCMLDISTYSLALWRDRAFVGGSTRRAMDCALGELARYRLHHPRLHANPFAGEPGSSPGAEFIPPIPAGFHATVDKIVQEHQEGLQQDRPTKAAPSTPSVDR